MNIKRKHWILTKVAARVVVVVAGDAAGGTTGVGITGTWVITRWTAIITNFEKTTQ